MNRKEITSDWIDRFNEGLLNEDEIEQFNKQLSIDPMLRLETRMDAELGRLIADRDCLALMDQLNSVMKKDQILKTGVNLYVLAAGILLLLAVSAFLLYFSTVYKPVQYIGLAATQYEYQSSGNQASIAEYKQSQAGITEVPATGADALNPNRLAEVYQPFPEFDMLAGSASRSSLVWIRSPLNGSVFSQGEMIRFLWSGSMSAGVDLVVMNNKGVKVYEKKIVDPEGFAIPGDGLPLGLLYWKIIDKDDLVAAGKFVVR
jgi:hypothetical protein